MRSLIMILCIFFIGNLIFAEQNYNVYEYGKYSPAPNMKKILFIMDYSNSMNEVLGSIRKIDAMTQTMEELLKKINPNTEMGLRIYGYRIGFTPWDCCKASRLAVPIERDNNYAISETLKNTKARGMTPITYSLKMAIQNDLNGIEGQKHIILLSDGGENCDESPCTYAIELMKLRDDITIDVIAFDLYDEDANNQLRCAALATRGKFYSAENSEELSNSLFDSLGIDKNVHGTIKLNK